LKILIASSTGFLPHFNELEKELKKNNIDCKIIIEYYYNAISSKITHRYRKKREYRKIIREFNPDFVIVDSAFDFGLEAISANKPLLILLRGDFWKERKLIFQKVKKLPHRILNVWLINNIAERCYKNSSMILPVCRYLQDMIEKKYPDKPTKVLHIGINPIHWDHGNGMDLKHPCVGLVQKASIWDKTKEMLILPKILEKFPNVEFYWVGDGQYSDEIISVLNVYKNFHWLGSLTYPEKVRDFLSEIDIFALFSGLDMTPLSILEASLMCKPVVATNVGGLSETIKDKETGFLAEKGNYTQWINHLQFLFDNPDKAKMMGEQGRKFILEEFNLESMAKNLISYCEFTIENTRKF